MNIKEIINKYLQEKKEVCSVCGRTLKAYTPKGKKTHMVCPVWVESIEKAHKEGHTWK